MKELVIIGQGPAGISAALYAVRGGASVTEVALACGFSSPAYFAQQFGRRYGCTPRAWRAACKP